MAEVYLAEQLSLRRQVALKVLRSNLAGDEAYIRRFQHEAQAAAKLVHANIVQIHEVGCIDGTYFIAQEYVPGQNLKQLLGRLESGVVGAVQAVNIIRQVAAALHKAAEQNIIHRDVKPENIMISPTGEVKVADFGLARVVRDGEALNLTQVGITMGTPLYMSPEQVEGRPVDPRSDLYSFGVTCYHMLAGRPPFDGETALAVAVQHLKNEPKRLEALRPDLPEGLCRIVHKMLAKKPEDRYQRAVDLLKDLKGLKIEGLDEDWTADLPGFNSADLALSTAGRLAATQHLDRVLRSEQGAGSRWSGAALAWLLLGLVAASLGIGGGLAWANRPKSLLAIEQPVRSQVNRCETVAEQYAQAQFASKNQEAEWRAVFENFPPDAEGYKRFSRLAKKGLAAYLYSLDGREREAIPLYQELREVEATERDFRLAGAAGLAIVRHKLLQKEEERDEGKQRDQEREKKLETERQAIREYVSEVAKAEAQGVDLRLALGSFLAGEIEPLFEIYKQTGAE
jgi:serine/threonine-protein kinase